MKSPPRPHLAELLLSAKLRGERDSLRLSNPKIMVNVVRDVRRACGKIDISRTTQAALQNELELSLVLLYENGRCEDVLPAIDIAGMQILEWRDISLPLVATAGDNDTNAGKVVWLTSLLTRDGDYGEQLSASAVDR